MHNRYLYQYVIQDLPEKMVFIGGPRQVGKTFFAKNLMPEQDKICYLNWDFAASKEQILKEQLPLNNDLIILDEIHKYANWRNFIKGYYDQHKETIKILVTGSARLDYYRKGGDSLLGRYHYYRLHPLSLGEIGYTKTGLQNLLQFGGFPEPFFGQSEIKWRRWQRERINKIIEEDLRDLEKVKEISQLLLLGRNLGARVGSPLSVNNLARLLTVAHATVERWLTIFENLYLCFRIAPYGSDEIRAVKKEQKMYLWDWSEIEDLGAKFENMVASQLLKYCHFLEDTQGYRMELRYIRDTDSREIDFVVMQENKALFAVECKAGEKEISPHIKYFAQKLNIKQYYQVHLEQKDYTAKDANIRVLPWLTFCKELKMP